MGTNADNKKIRKIFKNRCVICRKSADHVHEIIPKSLTKDWKDWENRVPLCVEDHTMVHARGSQNVKSLLEINRKRMLEGFYGKEYNIEIERLFF